MIKKPVLADLKPASGFGKTDNLEELKAAHVAKLEKLAADQLEEICELRRELTAEKSKNMELERRIQEMTQFLEDYGLQWVGGPRPGLEEYANGPEKYEFLRKVEELNALTENNKMEFEKVGNVQVLKVQKGVAIVLHDDGFTVDDGELRPYCHPLNVSFMKDIMDGFFPHEFKKDYPDGVRLKVEDRRTRRAEPPPADDLEMLPPPTNIGEGDGAVKVRIPAIPDVTIKIAKTQTVQDLMELIEHNFDIRNFKLCSPMSREPLAPDKTVGDAGLYPKGMALVLFL